MIDPIALLMALVLAMFNFSGQVQDQVEEKKETTVQSQAKETKKSETPKKSKKKRTPDHGITNQEQQLFSMQGGAGSPEDRRQELRDQGWKQNSKGKWYLPSSGEVQSEWYGNDEGPSKQPDTLDWACEGIALDEEYEACIDDAGKEYN